MSSNEAKPENTPLEEKKEDNKPKYECVSCDKEFEDKENLKGHIRRGSCAGMEDEKDPVDVHLEMALNELEKIVGKDEIKPTNVLLFALSMEQVVEKFDNIEGQQKKELVMQAFKHFMDKHGGDTHGALKFLPAFIDVSISLDRGEATIKMDTEEVMTCCAGLFSTVVNSAKKKK